MNAVASCAVCCLLGVAFSACATSVSPTPLRFGVDDAGGPHPLYEHPKADEIFDVLGFDLWITHFLPPTGRYGSTEHQLAVLRERGVVFDKEDTDLPPDLVATRWHIRNVDTFCRENDMQWIANLESANWIASYVDGKGREWYAQPDGRHFFRFPDDVLDELAEAGQLLGVLFDEPEHMQNTNDATFPETHGIAGLGRPFMYDPTGDTLAEAAERFSDAVAEEGLRYRVRGLRVFTEHVFPVMFHPFARAGYTAAPKVLKESWSPLVVACALGAALQYDTELWITPDLWGMRGYPTHSPEAYRSALLLAYHLGADCIYTENIAYDHEQAGYGSLVYMTEDAYRITPHGAVTKQFIHDYVPANPRYYRFNEVRPRVAIIRQPDGCWGQRESWLPDTLFGHPDWHSTPETEAWFSVWHLLSLGTVSSSGLTWHAAAMHERPQQVFMPLDGVVVFDHLVEARFLEDVEAIFLTGIGISDGTRAAVEAQVQRGAVCFSLPHLAPSRIREETGDNGTTTDGAGRWVVATDFLADHVRTHVAPFLPEPDVIRYQFGDATVTLRMVDDDPNRLEASVSTPTSQE